MPRIILTIAVLATFAVSAPGMAQTPTPPPTRTLDDLEKTCKSETPGLCTRVVAHARQRYGTSVTPMQWQSSVRAVSYQMSQGR